MIRFEDVTDQEISDFVKRCISRCVKSGLQSSLQHFHNINLSTEQLDLIVSSVLIEIFAEIEQPSNIEFMTEDQIVDDMFSRLSEGDIEALRQIPSADQMIEYHSSIGRAIRNEYHLWHPANPIISLEYQIVDGVNVNPRHPDQVSFNILTRIWAKANDKTI